MEDRKALLSAARAGITGDGAALLAFASRHGSRGDVFAFSECSAPAADPRLLVDS